MILMPYPTAHALHCFKDWAASKAKKGKPRVCHNLVPKGVGRGKLVFGDQSLAWEDLKPQLIWRGTDFNYLGKVYRSGMYDYMSRWADGVARRAGAIEDPAERRAAATRAMRRDYGGLLPRWKGVVLSAEARREAEESGEEGAEPWADVRFVPLGRRGGIYRGLAALGISAVGERMSTEGLGKYRYHVDIGGGGESRPVYVPCLFEMPMVINRLASTPRASRTPPSRHQAAPPGRGRFKSWPCPASCSTT